MGWLWRLRFLHPVRRPLTPDLIAKPTLRRAQPRAARRFSMDAPGWRRTSRLEGATARTQRFLVLLFHGVADNAWAQSANPRFCCARIQRGDDGSAGSWRKRWCDALRVAERNDTRAVAWTRWSPRAPTHTFCPGRIEWARASALQSAGVDPRIEAVVAERRSPSLREASYDYAGSAGIPVLAKRSSHRAPGMMLYRGGKTRGFPASGVLPGKCGGREDFPVLLICDEADTTLLPAAMQNEFTRRRRGRSLLGGSRAFHTARVGFAPEEFRSESSTFSASPVPSP